MISLGRLTWTTSPRLILYLWLGGGYSLCCGNSNITCLLAFHLHPSEKPQTLIRVRIQNTTVVRVYSGEKYSYTIQEKADRRMKNLEETHTSMSFKMKFFRQLWARQNSVYWTAIQRRGSMLAWIVILSVYGADTIAIDLSLSALISWFMKSIIGVLNNSNLHAIISTLLITNLQWVNKIYFAVLEEI